MHDNYMAHRGVQLSVKPDPPDKSSRPDHPTANSYSDGYGFHFYIFSGFGRVMDYPFFDGYPPNPPNTYIKLNSTPPHLIFLSLSHIFCRLPNSQPPSLPRLHHDIMASQPHRLTGSPYLSPSFTLSFPPLFHRHEAAMVQPLSRRLLGEELAITGWSRSGETSPDLVRSRQI